MKKLILFWAVCAPLAVFAQSTLTAPTDSTNKSTHESVAVKPVEPTQPPLQGEVYTIVERMPEFPGGQSGLTQYLSNNLTYPLEAREMAIEGKVYLSFIIDVTGQVRNVEILRGIYASIDKEAMRVVRMMPRWKPGTQGGKPVNVKFNLPINFQLK